MQHITVVPYDPAWPGLYEAEAQAIAGVLGQRLTAIPVSYTHLTLPTILRV